MVKVILWGGLRAYADGKSEFEFDAATIHDVIARLGEDYPASAIAIGQQCFRRSRRPDLSRLVVRAVGTGRRSVHPAQVVRRVADRHRNPATGVIPAASSQSLMFDRVTKFVSISFRESSSTD